MEKQIRLLPVLQRDDVHCKFCCQSVYPIFRHEKYADCCSSPAIQTFMVTYTHYMCICCLNKYKQKYDAARHMCMLLPVKTWVISTGSLALLCLFGLTAWVITWELARCVYWALCGMFSFTICSLQTLREAIRMAPQESTGCECVQLLLIILILRCLLSCLFFLRYVLHSSEKLKNTEIYAFYVQYWMYYVYLSDLEIIYF